MDDNRRRRARKLAQIVAVANFLGLCSVFLLLFLPQKHMDSWLFTVLFGLAYFIIFLFLGAAGLGILEAIIIGFIAYFIFRFSLPAELSRIKLRIIIIVSVLISAAIGVLSFQTLHRFAWEALVGKEKIWDIDTNGDGKSDKCVHDNIYSHTTEIDYDTNLDGKPDVWEYYDKNQKVYKKRSEERRVGKECRSRWSPYH